VVEDEFLSTGIIDPQGSVVATTSKQQVVDGAAATVWSGLSLFDEYGSPVTAKTTDTGALDYSWLGGKERATDTTGLALMDVRLYNSVTERFTSVDPVKGGNTTRYSYPQDPVDRAEYDGRSVKDKVRKVTDKFWDGINRDCNLRNKSGLCNALFNFGDKHRRIRWKHMESKTTPMNK
jgi:RHS repeat-associated protein